MSSARRRYEFESNYAAQKGHKQTAKADDEQI